MKMINERNAKQFKQPPTEEPAAGWKSSTHIGNRVEITPFVDIAKTAKRIMTIAKDNFDV